MSKFKTQEKFLLDCDKIHGDKYLYNNTIYTSDKVKVEIECRIHGSFYQTPHIHLKGSGCPDCGKTTISNKMKDNAKNGIIKGWSFINSDINRRSYPEKFFINVFENNDLFKKFRIKEKFSYGKYFIDFLFVDIKLIVEVDGSQHYQTPEAIKHDEERDLYFIKEGFKIYRINWKDVYKSPKVEIDSLLDFIENINIHKIRKYNIKNCSYIKKSLKNNKCKLCDVSIWHTSVMCIKCSNTSRNSQK